MKEKYGDIWVVIPAYREARVISTTVSDVRAIFKNVVVVDDCSNDRTGDLAHEAGAFVCTHPINLGQGAALATGMRYALEMGATAVITFDADGQHRVQDAAKMANILSETGVDVVLGSRFLGDAIGITSRKKAFLRLATAFTRWTSGLVVTDTHNGLRCFTARAACAIRIKQNRMAHASEILNQISSLGLTYSEAPCVITYSDYSVAKGQKMRGAFNIIVDLAIRKLYK